MQFRPLSPQLRQRLGDAGLVAGDVEDLVLRALREDLGAGVDVTSRACIAPSQRSVGTFVARARGRVAGIDAVAAVVEVMCGAANSRFEATARDGGTVEAGDVIARVEASTRELLAAERCALNLLCHLSGIATTTAIWVAEVSNTGVVIRDTRKTTPGLRALEKYAVRCGGGENHRMSLSDGVLIKDNHIAAAGGVAKAYSLVRQHVRDQPIEIEVDSLEQLRIAIASGADVVLLDNMSPNLLKDAVRIGRQYEAATGVSILFEASGGLTLSTVRAVAESGVNFIAVGALTHSSQVLDIGLDFQTLE
jgi:nicotinate-nucleotide pyrophosphorylase (carboxylating)